MSDWLKGITNSLLAVLTRLSPHKNSPRNQPISKITVHHTAGNISLRALLDWLARVTTRASYNYGISSKGEIGLIVEERNRCWASSSAWNDNRAVVIGVANITGAPVWAVSDTAFDALVGLCVDVCERNPGIVRKDGTPGLYYDGTQHGSLTTHDMFANTNCPGPYLKARLGELCDRVNARLAGVLAAKEVPSDVSAVGVNVSIGGLTLHVSAENINGRWILTLPDGPEGQPQPNVLLRVVLEALGLNVAWDEATQTIVATQKV